MIGSTKEKNRENIFEPVDFDSDQQGNTLIATKHSLWLAQERSHSIEEIALISEKLPAGSYLTSVTLSDNGLLYVATDKGHILRFKMGSKLKEAALDQTIRVPGTITDMLLNNDLLWVGTSNGLFYILPDLKRFEAFTTDQSELSNNHVTQLYGHNDSVWVGTYQGLNRITFPLLPLLTVGIVAYFNDVLAFEEDRQNRLWVGTYSGAYFFDLSQDLKDNSQHIIS